MKKLLSILRDVVFVLFVLFICGMIFIMSTGKHVSIAGYQVLRVLTSSMEPAIAENTCIIIKECAPETLQVGDIITFTSDDPQIRGYYNTHRIHEIVEENGETLFVTKGDATSFVDGYPVHMDQVAGIYVRELPGGRMLGKCFVALSDNRVYFLVIMLPLTICLISYFWQIIGFVTGRYEEDDEDDEEEDEDDKDAESDVESVIEDLGDDDSEDENVNEDALEEKPQQEPCDSVEDIFQTSDEPVEDLLQDDLHTAGESEGELLQKPEDSEEEYLKNSEDSEEEPIVKTSEMMEKERINKIVEELMANPASDEVVEEKRAQLKEKYVKR